MIRFFIVGLLSAAMAFVAGAEPLTAEQNGDQKARYVVTVDGTNCWSRQVGDAARSGSAPYREDSSPGTP